MSSDNLIGADNQQERLDAYLAGFGDGEGSFHVAVQRNPSTSLGIQLVPEYHVSQNPERRQVLDLLQRRMGCGRIVDDHRGSRDRSVVFVVRRRHDLLWRVIPFFEAQPLVSSRQDDFLAFARIVRAMAVGSHLTAAGLAELLTIATAMNGGGRYRTVFDSEVVSGILRDHMPNTQAGLSEEMVRSAWRHAEPGRNALAPGQGEKPTASGNNNVGPYPVQP